MCWLENQQKVEFKLVFYTFKLGLAGFNQLMK